MFSLQSTRIVRKPSLVQMFYLKKFSVSILREDKAFTATERFSFHQKLDSNVKHCKNYYLTGYNRFQQTVKLS